MWPRRVMLMAALFLVAAYAVQVVVVQIRMTIPHLDVVEGDRRTVYRYGIGGMSGWIPLFGWVEISGDGVRVETYVRTAAGWQMQDSAQLDLFIDHPDYERHRAR